MKHIEGDDVVLLSTSREREEKFERPDCDTSDEKRQKMNVSENKSKNTAVGSSIRPDPTADQHPPSKPRLNGYIVRCAIGASINSILLGFFIKVSSGATMHIKRDLKLTNFESEALTALLKVLMLLGSVVAGSTADRKGRRFTIYLAGAILFLGPILMGFPGYGFFLIGHLLGSIGSGSVLTTVPIYIAEISPAFFRGSLTSYPEIFISLGSIIGYIFNHSFLKLPLDISWRVMYSVGAISLALLAVKALDMPESPHWLILQGRLGDAKRILTRTYSSNEEAKLRLANIKRAADIPEESNGDVVDVPKQSIWKAVWNDFLFNRSPPINHILTCLLAIHFFQVVFSIDTILIIFDKTEIFSFDTKYLVTLVVDILKTTFIPLAAYLLDGVGRRPLLLFSSNGMVFSLLFLGIGLTNIDHKNTKFSWADAMCIVSVIFHVIFYSIGIGPVTSVYSSEIFPIRHRAQGFTLGIAISQVLSILLSLVLLTLYEPNTLGWVAFSLAVIAIIASVFIKKMVPETKRQRLEETWLFFGEFTNWESTAREIQLQRTIRQPRQR